MQQSGTDFRAIPQASAPLVAFSLRPLRPLPWRSDDGGLLLFCGQITRRCSNSSTGYPRFVEHEFRRYLDCSALGRGFARVRCKACGFERLLSFSCKGRLCPSCQARHMHDLALYLGEQVIPSVPLRQWVLTVPRALRFALARDRER